MEDAEELDIVRNTSKNRGIAKHRPGVGVWVLRVCSIYFGHYI